MNRECGPLGGRFQKLCQRGVVRIEDGATAIRPCGLDPSIMTDLSRETGAPVEMDAARTAATACLPTLLGTGYAARE